MYIFIVLKWPWWYFLTTISSSLPHQDVEYIEGVHEKMAKLVERGSEKKLKPEFDCICKIRNMLLEEKKQLRFADWDTKEVSDASYSSREGRSLREGAVSKLCNYSMVISHITWLSFIHWFYGWKTKLWNECV